MQLGQSGNWDGSKDVAKRQQNGSSSSNCESKCEMRNANAKCEWQVGNANAIAMNLKRKRILIVQDEIIKVQLSACP